MFAMLSKSLLYIVRGCVYHDTIGVTQNSPGFVCVCEMIVSSLRRENDIVPSELYDPRCQDRSGLDFYRFQAVNKDSQRRHDPSWLRARQLGTALWGF